MIQHISPFNSPVQPPNQPIDPNDKIDNDVISQLQFVISHIGSNTVKFQKNGNITLAVDAVTQKSSPDIQTMENLLSYSARNEVKNEATIKNFQSQLRSLMDDPANFVNNGTLIPSLAGILPVGIDEKVVLIIVFLFIAFYLLKKWR